MRLFTKLETEALGIAIGEIQAGDSEEFFNNGCQVDDPPKGKEQKRAVRLAAALNSAYTKIIQNGR